MNFLAHVALSGEREGILMGNYVGDFIKGQLTELRTESWPADFRLGVELHRFIDNFTDTNQGVLQAKRIVAIKHPKVAGVALDIYFDYFLANHFSKFYQEDLAGFVMGSYEIIQRNRQLIPAAMLSMAEAMIRHDWLLNYKDISGIKRSFDGLSRRFAFMGAIKGAEEELQRNQQIYQDAFMEFYPKLKRACEKFIENY
ncbi:acyl carrier protein phosphodiesterase [Persicitalea jodogahamensis]|uniref:ACP phosphodiesterase n=1 Tax=Persicitalea jodogahamensis TaxID=402147 RepID=A0A8J3DC51_9BACT|nr:ACP phosphodiesterase [Persicitalea jodogahamensis]GHB82123.1 ACP phosphodiesterase [Persicitalea jodogahamensis]